MTRNIILISLLLALASCREDHSAPEVHAGPPVAGPDYHQYEGIYEGDFGGGGDIRLVLRHVTGTHAVGYSLHKGLQRNMSGAMREDKDGYDFELQEPGDNRYDGLFDFSIDRTGTTLTGKWQPLNDKGMTAKRFVLKKVRIAATDTAQTYSVAVQRYMYDSTGEYFFEPGGLCIYRYYTDKADTMARSQYEEIKGNWKKTDKEYIIDWQKNSVFPARCIFRMVPYPELEGVYYLEGGGRKIEPQLAG